MPPWVRIVGPLLSTHCRRSWARAGPGCGPGRGRLWIVPRPPRARGLGLGRLRGACPTGQEGHRSAGEPSRVPAAGLAARTPRSIPSRQPLKQPIIATPLQYRPHNSTPATTRGARSCLPLGPVAQAARRANGPVYRHTLYQPCLKRNTTASRAWAKMSPRGPSGRDPTRQRCSWTSLLPQRRHGGRWRALRLPRRWAA